MPCKWKVQIDVKIEGAETCRTDLVYKDILEDEDNLKTEINKLQDEEYVARYAREKYLYSKDGELIIKIK